MDTNNFEFRLHRLEQAFDGEKIPYRMQAVEIGLAQIQGEVVAVKEIARGIGTKLDAGLTGLERSLSAEIDKLRIDQARNQAFIKGIVWIGAGLVTFVSGAPMAAEALKRLMGI